MVMRLKSKQEYFKFQWWGEDFGLCFCFPMEWAETKPAAQRGAGGDGDPNPGGNAPWLDAGAAVSAGWWDVAAGAELCQVWDLQPLS